MMCTGPDWVIGEFLGSCSIAWFGLALTVLIGLVLRRQCDDGIFSGIGFNVAGAFVGGLGANLLLITIFGDPRWAFLAGILGLALGGWGIGLIAPSESGGDYE